MYKIFLVEDDFSLAKEIKKGLESYDNDVIVASDFKDVLGQFNKGEPHLVILDIKLPFYTGFHWCEQIRKESNVPIVFLSSASDDMNIVTAMSMGGDDFIAKPVDGMVLNAKVSALLRRTYELSKDEKIFKLGDASLNALDASISYNDKKIELTKNELKILVVLLENVGKIVTREKLMKALWQSDFYVEENTLTVNIGRLRKKLESIGLGEIIITKPGIGYIINE